MNLFNIPTYIYIYIYLTFDLYEVLDIKKLNTWSNLNHISTYNRIKQGTILIIWYIVVCSISHYSLKYLI